MTRIVAHRGSSGRAPENTLAAFRLALAEPEIHMIELDVHLSADGIPVVIHDHTLERTTNGSGRVEDHTFEQLQQLDAGGWFAPEYAGERVPSLEEVLRLAKGRCRLQIELKTMGDLYPGIEAEVIGLIHRYEMKEEVFVSSFDHESMKRAHDLDPSIATGLIVLGRPTLVKEQLLETGASSLSIHYAFLTREWMERMRADSVDIGVWTVDDPDTMARIVREFPKVRITTNYPERLLRIVKEQPAML